MASINGLRNLQLTYADDRNFYCEVDTLIGSMCARLAEFYDKDNVYITEETKLKINGMIIPTRIVQQPVQVAQHAVVAPLIQRPVEE